MFKFVDRKQKFPLVIVPGWAFDYRVFDTLDLPYNYIFFRGESLDDFEDKLKEILAKNNISRISLLGWSQGAFAACDFACENPDTVEEVILIGTRKKYDKKALTDIKEYLKKNKKAYLYKFYRQCFSEDEEKSYRWFRESLLKNYLKQFSLPKLIRTLEQLGQAKIEPTRLKKLNRLTIVHGRNDLIAPVDEASNLADTLPQCRLIVFDKAGHLPFLRKDFRKRLYEC